VAISGLISRFNGFPARKIGAEFVFEEHKMQPIENFERVRGTVARILAIDEH
jgi:hypothetical protein